MPHTTEETLAAAQVEYPDRAHEASPTHPGEDIEWWIADEEHNTFALGTWDDGTINFRDYKP